MRFRVDFEPLRVPAYRRYFLAWSVALTAGWIFGTTQSWTFLQSSGTAAAVAYLPIVLVLPVPVALVIGGILTDRRGPRTVLVFAQVATGLTIGSIGLLAATHNLTFWPTLVAGALLGTFGGLGSVPGQAIMVRLVERRLVASAYALSLMTYGIGRLIGGPLGGTIVQSVGAAPAFALSACGFLVAAAMFRTLPKVDGLQAAATGLSRQDLADAVGWARGMPNVVAIVALEAVAAGLIGPYQAVMPVIARDVLHGGPTDLGLLIAAGGVGVVLGGALMGPLGARIGHGRFLVCAVAGSICGIATLSISTSLVVSCVLVALAAGADNSSALTRGLLLQTVSPARLRGRVLALNGVVSAVASPACLLAVGLLVERFGATPIILGMASLAGSALVAVTVTHRSLLSLSVQGTHAQEDAAAAAEAAMSEAAIAADART